MYEDQDEMDEMDEAAEMDEMENTELAESKINQEFTESDPGLYSDITFGGACDESFWKSRAEEYYADGNMGKYRECMEKAAAAAIS